ncbi:MAG: hypothetical protein WCY27_01380 [archaeon]
MQKREALGIIREPELHSRKSKMLYGQTINPKIRKIKKISANKIEDIKIKIQKLKDKKPTLASEVQKIKTEISKLEQKLIGLRWERDIMVFDIRNNRDHNRRFRQEDILFKKIYLILTPSVRKQLSFSKLKSNLDGQKFKQNYLKLLKEGKKTFKDLTPEDAYDILFRSLYKN